MALRDRVIRTLGARGDLTLYRLDRATEITCARCHAHQTTRQLAILADDWTKPPWCKSCYLTAPTPPAPTENGP